MTLLCSEFNLFHSLFIQYGSYLVSATFRVLLCKFHAILISGTILAIISTSKVERNAEGSEISARQAHIR